MAKHFTDTEKSDIISSLFHAGLKRFLRVGVRAVRIDDLCKDVGIAKGSFYAFFPSKEALFMAIAQQRDDHHKSDMRKFLDDFSGSSKQFANAFFDLIIAKINSDPLLQLMSEHGEIEYLFRKIPAQMLKDNAQADRKFVEEMAIALRRRNPHCATSADQIDGLMTLAVALSLQRIMPPSHMRNAHNVLRQIFIDCLSSQSRPTQIEHVQ